MMKFIWNELDKNIDESYDLFICSVSFEERCLSFAKHCPRNRIKNAMVCRMIEYDPYISNNLECMKELFISKKIQYTLVELQHKDPIFSADAMMVQLDEKICEKGIHNVIVDITTFSHEMTLILLLLFKQKYINVDVTFVYSNANEYDPNRNIENGSAASLSNKWLSKGIGEIRSVLGYPGNLMPARSIHLVIVVGYEYDRAISIISEMEPSSLSLIFGKSDMATTGNEKHYGAKEHFDATVKDSLAFLPIGKIYDSNISCNDPETAKIELQEHLVSIADDLSDKNIVVFAMNNKVSTLGVGLLALERDDIQLCYAPAQIYNYANYSTPGDSCYMFKPFSKD